MLLQQWQDSLCSFAEHSMGCARQQESFCDGNNGEALLSFATVVVVVDVSVLFLRLRHYYYYHFEGAAKKAAVCCARITRETETLRVSFALSQLFPHDRMITCVCLTYSSLCLNTLSATTRVLSTLTFLFSLDWLIDWEIDWLRDT